MALTMCPECKGKVSDSAKTCPHCGKPQNKRGGCFPAALILFGALIFILFASAIATNIQTPTDTKSRQTQTAPRLSSSPDDVHECAKCGDANAIKNLIARSSQFVDQRDQHQRTPLHYAAMGGHSDVVKLLLDNGADVNAKDVENKSALFQAAGGGYRSLVELLVARGARVNDVEKHGGTPLLAAVISGDQESVKFLLAKGADAYTKDITGHTPLDAAGIYKDYAMMRILREAPRVAHTVTVHEVAEDGNMERLSFFLTENPSCANARDQLGRTPLQLAANKTKLAAVELLLERGADVNASDPRGWTPLHFAVLARTKDQVKNVVDLLLRKEADVNARDSNGTTPLINAAWTGQKEVVALLLEKGADPNARDKDGCSALQATMKFLETTKGIGVTGSQENWNTVIELLRRTDGKE